MKTFKTPKGTELPMLNLKGKDYLQVAYRLVWMREEHPDWSILTERIEANEKFVIFKASILTANSQIIAQAHKREDYAHFPDANEKAETSAIGRALALCGYGTQFAPELDEAERIVDSPVDRVPPQQVSAPWVPGKAEQDTVKALLAKGGLDHGVVTAFIRSACKKEKLAQLTEQEFFALCEYLQREVEVAQRGK